MSGLDLSAFNLDLMLAGINVAIIVACIVLDRRSQWIGPLAFLLLSALFVASWLFEPSAGASGVFVADSWMFFLRRLLIGVAAVTVLGSLRFVNARFEGRRGEYYSMLLLSLQGLLLMPGARDLLLLFVAFELASLPMYVLAAYDRRDGASAAEIGFKFYLAGAVGSAIALFGMALASGLAGGTSFAVLAAAQKTPALGLGVLMILAGMGYKLGVAPFHMWIPDTYERASTPFVAFLAVAPKIAGLAAAMNLFFTSFAQEQAVWLPVLPVLAGVSLVVGGLMALHQTDLKRLLAYSGVAHMGYALAGFAAGTEFGVEMTLFYLGSYAATSVGVFLALHVIAGEGGAPVHLEGLSRRSPGLALALLLFFLSLAGVPFVVGFWAKLYVLLSAYRAGLLWLVVLAAVMTVVSLYYYLRVAGSMYLKEPSAEDAKTKLVFDRSAVAAVMVCAALVVVMGAWPDALLGRASEAAAEFWRQRPH